MFSCFNFLLYEKSIPKIFELSVFRLIHSRPFAEYMHLIPFRPPIPAIPHFNVLGFNPDTFKKLSKTFKSSIKGFWFFRKKAVSSGYAVYHRDMLYIKIHIQKLHDKC